MPMFQLAIVGLFYFWTVTFQTSGKFLLRLSIYENKARHTFESLKSLLPTITFNKTLPVKTMLKIVFYILMMLSIKIILQVL